MSGKEAPAVNYGELSRMFRVDPDRLRDWYEGRTGQTFATPEAAAQALQQSNRSLKEASRLMAERHFAQERAVAEEFQLSLSALRSEYAEGDWPTLRMAAEHLRDDRTARQASRRARPWWLRWLP